MNVLGICGTNKKGGNAASEWFLTQALEAARKEGAEVEDIPF